ncbi:MAG TPA: sulfatase-like hydrolase/transferase [Bryobacteraceae bacterium]|nr:sulfatase-like hydrolase/transferase [Bryobacteraceae bacterium]
MKRRTFLQGALARPASSKPNVLQILIDDMGYADLKCYGGPISTPNIDRIAAEGIRFTQASVASPICSPSRVAIMTGQFPSRHRVYSYFDTRKRQRELGMPDYLDLKAPSVARTFQQAGYATGHFGKWHMGGGRDVGDAPLPTEYGFDESLTSFEGLGNRVLPPGRLSEMNEKLGRGKISHAPQADLTGIYVDRTIEFIRRSREAMKPFYVHLWLNDVHDPFAPKPELMTKYEAYTSNKYVQQYFATIDEMDRQIGRLLESIDDNTLVVLLSDNGPTAWPRYYQEGLEPPGSTGGLRGRKWSLYEGGIRVPMMARLPGRIPAGRTDQTTVVSSLDLFPTCCRLAAIAAPGFAFDGEDMSAAFLGRQLTRRRDLFWEYGRDATYLRPARRYDQSPNLAIRSGRWKLLMNDDGSSRELYDLQRWPIEDKNVAAEHADVTRKLANRLLSWRRSLP